MGILAKSQQRIHVCIEKAKTPSEKSDIYFMLMQSQATAHNIMKLLTLLVKD